VESFLESIDRASAKGRRDYAMFLLIATYGLRASEVAALETNRYAAVGLEMKRAAVAKARPVGVLDPAVAAWRTDKTILEWLESL
jgi:integrase